MKSFLGVVVKGILLGCLISAPLMFLQLSQEGYFEPHRADETHVVIESGMCQQGYESFFTYKPDKCHARTRSLTTGQEWVISKNTYLMTGRNLYRYCWIKNGDKECHPQFKMRPYTFKDNWYYKIGQFLTGAK